MTLAALAGLVAVLGVGVCLWLVSLWLEDASIVDIVWGPFFVVIAGTVYAVGTGSGPRLPLVFLLQPLLAWVVAAPVIAVMLHAGPPSLGLLDLVATLVCAMGLGIETVADAQLSAFRRDPRHRDQVLDSGLFRYSRHPNYFGEFVVWWGFGLFGLGAGSIFSLVGPALMTLLLLRVSGVTLLESTIATRRPGYARYQATTNAFFPGPPRRAS
jgi:steroid 5-alpha reductase family enzyme